MVEVVDGVAKKERWNRHRLSSRILVATSLLGLGYFCYAYRKHYIHDGEHCLYRILHPSMVSRVMKSVHLFPAVLPDSFSNYSVDLYCERLARSIVTYNPLHWVTMNDVYSYFQQWFTFLDQYPASLHEPISEDRVNSFLIWLFRQSPDNRLFVIGERCFQVSPISSALLSECMEYFKEAMQVRTHVKDIQLDLSKKRVLGLIDEVEQQFDIELKADPYQPSFEDELIRWEWKKTNADIRERKELKSECIDVFDFVDIMAAVASQLHQDNQLLLVIHKHVVQMLTTDGKHQLKVEREEQRQKDIHANRQLAQEIIREHCEGLSENEVIDFLLGERKSLLWHRIKELLAIEFNSDLTRILHQTVNEELDKHQWW